jgi:hypothetical protein
VDRFLTRPLLLAQTIRQETQSQLRIPDATHRGGPDPPSLQQQIVTRCGSPLSSGIDRTILFLEFGSMKITVEMSDSEIEEICRVTGEKKKGPAIRRLVADALMLKRREKAARKFIDAESGVELEGFESAQAADQAADHQGEVRWRQ